MSPLKDLVVFDFDHTIVDDNSDTFIHAASPAGSVPEKVTQTYVKGQWLAFMNTVFSHLSSEGVGIQRMQQHMEGIPFTPGMHELLHHLADNPERYECIILSDANDFFIRWILSARGLLPAFSAILTNSARLVGGTGTGAQQQQQQQPGGGDEGAQHKGRAVELLRVEPYHSHSCTRCNHNLCKQTALREFLLQRQQQQQQDATQCTTAAAEAVTPAAASTCQGELSVACGVQPVMSLYRRVLYVGDGSNDLCPALGLGSGDVVMPRVGYSLHELVRQHAPAAAPTSGSQQQQQQQEEGPQAVGLASMAHGLGCCLQGQGPEAGASVVRASVVAWRDGHDILAWLRNGG